MWGKIKEYLFGKEIEVQIIDISGFRTLVKETKNNRKRYWINCRLGFIGEIILVNSKDIYEN